MLAVVARAHARRVLNRFLGDARNARAVQDRVLMTHVRANADSAYGKKHGFRAIRNYVDFVRQVPVSTYAELSPWIERVKAGDVGAMFGGRQRVRMFAMTSGTVDRPKYVPVTDRFLADLRAGWNAFGVKALMDHPECFVRSIVQVTSSMDEERTSGDYPCGAITGLMAATQKRLVRKYYVSPLCVASISDTVARRYTIMRLAIPADVAWVVTASPATTLQLAKTGEAFAQTIIRDVFDGTLSEDFQIPGWVRQALKPRLRPDRTAGRRLSRILETSGSLRPKDYWNLGFLANWTGGTMGLYLREFPAYFGELPVRDIGLLATEGRMSIPIEDGTPAGIAAVSSAFFEFIPAEERESPNPTLLRTHEVEPGREYFILLTTSAGFYRYDISDCVRVTGFEGEAPIIEFLHKGDHVSSITGEKLTERQVVLAFERASRSVGVETPDFVLAPQWADPPFYRLYLERPASHDTRDCSTLAHAFDAELKSINMEYASKRSSGRMGEVSSAVLRSGVLARLDHSRAARHRRGNEQFKHQYLLARCGEDEALASGLRESAAVTGSTSDAPVNAGSVDSARGT